MDSGEDDSQLELKQSSKRERKGANPGKPGGGKGSPGGGTKPGGGSGMLEKGRTRSEHRKQAIRMNVSENLPRNRHRRSS